MASRAICLKFSPVAKARTQAQTISLSYLFSISFEFRIWKVYSVWVWKMCAIYEWCHSHLSILYDRIIDIKPNLNPFVSYFVDRIQMSSRLCEQIIFFKNMYELKLLHKIVRHQARFSIRITCSQFPLYLIRDLRQFSDQFLFPFIVLFSRKVISLKFKHKRKLF